MFNDEFYEIKNSDMAKAELDSEFGTITLDKKLFSLKPKRRFKLKPIVKHGEMEKIIIRAPYGFIVKLFEVFNYKPDISYDHCLEDKYGRYYRYIYTEEWHNPHYKDDDGKQNESIIDDSDDLPF